MSTPPPGPSKSIGSDVLREYPNSDGELSPPSLSGDVVGGPAGGVENDSDEASATPYPLLFLREASPFSPSRYNVDGVTASPCSRYVSSVAAHSSTTPLSLSPISRTVGIGRDDGRDDADKGRAWNVVPVRKNLLFQCE